MFAAEAFGVGDFAGLGSEDKPRGEFAIAIPNGCALWIGLRECGAVAKDIPANGLALRPKIEIGAVG